jgi:hypothetical protein
MVLMSVAAALVAANYVARTVRGARTDYAMQTFMLLEPPLARASVAAKSKAAAPATRSAVRDRLIEGRMIIFLMNVLPIEMVTGDTGHKATGFTSV